MMEEIHVPRGLEEFFEDQFVIFSRDPNPGVLDHDFHLRRFYTLLHLIFMTVMEGGILGPGMLLSQRIQRQDGRTGGCIVL
jgi:hypothetical protein